MKEHYLGVIMQRGARKKPMKRAKNGAKKFRPNTRGGCCLHRVPFPMARVHT